jgi:tRNA(His) 5'-end guanylyltransferase
MKNNYELRCRRFLPRRSYVIVRVDGRSFHTWTRGLEKPYDKHLLDAMDATALELCGQVAGCKLGYVQSDEISLVLTDFDTIETEAWFDNCQNKLESITASIATMAFNLHIVSTRDARTDACLNDPGSVPELYRRCPDATFDSRAFVIPDYVEVENYLIDRQKDAMRNSVTMLASKYASHKKLNGVTLTDRLALIKAAGDNWDKHSVRFKQGGVVYNTGGEWVVSEEPKPFTKNREWLRLVIPRHWEEEPAA